MRNINQELEPFIPDWIKKRNAIGMKTIMNSRYPFVYCPECGEKIVNDNGRISRHFKEKHIKERKENESRGYRFHPVPS